MANYLVLGGSGFIGKPLIKHLKNHNHDVTNLDIRENPSIDLRNTYLGDLSRFDGCIFLAWDVGGSKYLNSVATWQTQYENNIGLINNVFPQLAKSNIRTIFVSSQLAGIDDSPYSLTKLMAEKYAMTINNFVVARQWNAYGDMEIQDLRSHVISDFVFQAVTTGEIVMITDGTEKRKFIHMSDIAEAYLLLLEGGHKGIFDVSGDDYVSIFEIAELIASMTNASLKSGSSIGVTPAAPEIPRIPGWNPKIAIKDGIREMISTLPSA